MSVHEELCLLGLPGPPSSQEPGLLEAFLWRDHCPASGERWGGLAWAVEREGGPVRSM